MAHEKFFISDTHFFHANILKFVDDNGQFCRQFNDIDEMNEKMVEKWNSVVKDGDYVYHLGDVTFNYDRPFRSLMSRLKGKKRLILGNHDKIKGTVLLDYFEKVDLWKGFKEGNFTCTHIPIMLPSLRDGAFNVHGHIHQNVMDDPHYINVCVEQRNYTPVHMDTILAEIKKV